MSFEKKTWEKRISEYPNRRKIVKEDGSSEIVIVDRYEGSVSTEGDAFSPDNMNGLEQRILDAFGVLPKEIRTAVASTTTNVNELTTAGTWYLYNKVCTGVPSELDGVTILALVKNEVFSNIIIQTLTNVSNGLISEWKRRYSSTGGWENWYKDINSNDMSKMRTMHIGLEALGIATTTTITLSDLMKLMDNVSETTFFVNSSRYPGIYAEILTGIQTAYPNITSIGAHVTIRKNGTTSYITVEDYSEPSNKFECIYKFNSNTSNWDADNWVKYITTSDTESRRMYMYPSNFGCSNSDTTLTLTDMINAMDAKSYVNFWINNTGQYTNIYNGILNGFEYEILKDGKLEKRTVDGISKYGYSDIYGNVTIEKTDGTAYVKVSSYEDPSKVFTATYSTVNSRGWSQWEKKVTVTDLSKKTGIAVQYNTITPTSTEISDVLQVDLSNPYSTINQPRKVYQQTSDTKAITNMPSAYPKGTSFVGMRYVHYFSSTNVLVELIAFPGYRRWYNNYSGNAWKGWVCEPTNANNETMTKLRNDLDIVGETMTVPIVEVGFNDNIKVHATLCMKKLSKNKCDLHISYRISENTETNTSIVNFISGEKLRAALGVKTLSGSSHAQCQAKFSPSFDVSGEDLTIVAAETALSLMGFTGTGAKVTDDGVRLGRMYEKSDGTFAFGVWPIVAQKETLFKPNTYGQIDVYGADYTI